MSDSRALIIASLAAVGFANSAGAQSYYPPPASPCSQVNPPTLLGAMLSGQSAQQRRDACAAFRKGQWDEYNAKQVQVRAQEEADASQAAIQAQEEAERAAAAEKIAAADRRREERTAALIRYTAYEKRLAAEASPDNRCKTPEFARDMLLEWSNFDRMKELGVRAIDIEHLTTVEFDADSGVIVCHGVFVTNRGGSLIGTYSTRKNVAGDLMSSWKLDDTQDLSTYQAPAKPAEEGAPLQIAPVGPITQPARFESESKQSEAFARGLAARQGWETWLTSLSGDEKDGAVWWASSRNTPGHLTCPTAPSKDNAAWEAGCMNAQLKLASVDSNRRSDREYKRGWNSL